MGRAKRSLLCIVPIILITFGASGHCQGTFFEVDEILDALKNEIQTAQSLESGVPRLEIDKVEVWLSVFSETSDKDAVELKIVGTDETYPQQPNPAISHHTIHLSFNPNYFTDFTSEISSGLVEAISEAKASLKKTYLTPPNMTLNSVTFTIKFGVMRKKSGIIQFVTTDLQRFSVRSIPTHTLNIYMSIKND